MSDKPKGPSGRGIGSGFTGGDHQTTLMPFVWVILMGIVSGLVFAAPVPSRPFLLAGTALAFVAVCLGPKWKRARRIFFVLGLAAVGAGLVIALAGR